MKASITNNRQRKAEARKAAEKEVNEMIDRRWETFCEYADISLLYTLHAGFGFGDVRLKRFYRTWLEYFFQLKEQFMWSGDDQDKTHYDVMRKRLEIDGIFYKDYLKIQEEVEKEFGVNRDED